MFRRVLCVLALLPLLLPPGLCVCHAPTAACTAGTAGHEDGAAHAPLAHLCLAHGGDADHDDPVCPAHPHHHAPACPAGHGLDCTVGPGFPAPGMVLDLAGLVTPFKVPGVSAVAPAHGRCLDLPAGPLCLYLRLRTLLI
jgi:hypothetical protein